MTTLQEANIVLNKIIDYEKNPPTASQFYKSALICSDFLANSNGYESEYRYVECCEKINQGLTGKGLNINRVYHSNKPTVNKCWNDGTILPDYLQYPNLNWNGNKSDINYHLNNGCFIAMHRDHGETDGWVEPAYKTTDLAGLTNANALPVVFSINCSSGDFTSSNCFTSNMLKMNGGGCVGAIACTASSYTDINNVLAPGLFESIWPDGEFPDNYINDDASPAYRLGQILHAGYSTIDKFTNSFTTTSSQKYQKYIYHCFGDPSMRIYTKKPVAIAYRQNSLIIPNELVTISLYDPSFGIVRTANLQGPVTIPVPSATDTNIAVSTVTISGPNIKPYIIEPNGIITPQNEDDVMNDSDNYDYMECETNGSTLTVRYASSSRGSIEVSSITTGKTNDRKNINQAGEGFFKFNRL